MSSSSGKKKQQDKKSNGQVNGPSSSNKKSTTKIGTVPVDLKNPEPVDPEKVEAFRRIVSAEDFEELDDHHGNQNGLINDRLFIDLKDKTIYILLFWYALAFSLLSLLLFFIAGNPQNAQH